MTLLPSAALPSIGSAAPARIPHIVLYCLGNYTHPTTRHSLAQYLIPSLFEELLGVKAQRDSKGKELVRPGSDGLLRLHRKHDAWIGGGTGVVPAGQGASMSSKGGKKYIGQVSKQVTDEMQIKLTVVRPRLLMNVSGRPLPFLLKTLSGSPGIYDTTDTHASAHTSQVLPPTALVLHDSLSHDACTMSAIKYNTGPQGHNGLRSVESSLNSRAYHRLSLGIGRPPAERFRGDGVSEWVLGEMTKDDKLWWDGEGAKAVAREVWALARRLSNEANSVAVRSEVSGRGQSDAQPPADGSTAKAASARPKNDSAANIPLSIPP